MNTKIKTRLLSLLLCFVMLVGLMPTSVFAWTAPTLSGNGGDAWNVQLSDEGVLTWNDMGSATYDISVDNTPMGGTVTNIYSINTNAYNLINRFRELKLENGNYYFYIKANDTDTTSGQIHFMYVSPEAKLSEPQNLCWDETVAKWDSVANATEYEVSIYSNSGYRQLTRTTTETQYDWTTAAADGRWFEVIATAADYRNSNAAESPKYGSPLVPITYTVTFDSNGGSAVIAQSIEAGQKATKPADPSKANYAFAGWFSDSGLTQAFDFNTPISTDITLYAKWDVVITAVSATVTAPVGGEHPSFTVTVPDGAHYTAVVDTWYDLANNGAHLTNSDTFVTGNEYQARIHFTANIGYVIANSASYTINGTPNDTTFNTAEQRGMNFVATAYASTYTVTGSVTSFGSETDEVMIQLTESGAAEPAYEAVVKGNSASYTIEGVAPGTYTMKVMKKHHVTREYTVVVGNSSVIQDVKIYLFGDINGDGIINAQDALLVLKAAVDKYTPTAQEQQAGDVNADGTLDASDALLILKKAVDKIQTFPVEA